MNVRLSVAIMAVPERRSQVVQLMQKLGRRVPVVYDTKRRGAWWCAERAWRRVRGGSTHHLVLQDDVTVCRDFVASAEQAIAAHRPDAPICFYANRKAVEEARAKGDAWFGGIGLLWGQAICLPVADIWPMLGWCKRHVSERYFKYDRRVGLWAEAHERLCYCTVPSLVDHLGSTTSTMGHRTPQPRVARWYIGDNASGRSIDWTRGLAEPLLVRTKNRRRLLAEWLI